MRWKRHSAEEIYATLRHVQALVARGVPLDEATVEAGVARPTYFRWKREYGGLDASRIREIKTLGAENARLRRYMQDIDA